MRFAFAAMLLACALPARAESPLEKEAHEHYVRGQALLDAADYDGALKEFSRSYELTRYPAIFYRIALCQDQLGHAAEAIEAYRQYLESDPQSTRRAGIEARIEKLRAMLPAEKPAASPAAPPVEKPAPAPQALVAQPTPAVEQPHAKPIYKKWWLWTIVAVVAAGAAVGGAVAATTPHDAAIPGGAYTVHFPNKVGAQ
jgi:tetratricopeptide (TPR) repeat protein